MAYIAPGAFAAQERAKQRNNKRTKPFVPPGQEAAIERNKQRRTIEDAVGIGTSGQIQQAVGDFGQATIQGMQQVGGATQFQPKTPTLSASATGAIGGTNPTDEAMRLAQGGATPPNETTINQFTLPKVTGATLPQTQPANLSQLADQQLQSAIQSGTGAGAFLGGQGTLDTAVEQAKQREALGREFGYTDPTGQRGSGLIGQAEDVLRGRLQGGENPLVKQQREDFLRRSEQEEDALMQRLSSLGVLRGGDTSEALGDFIGQRERTLNDINALGYDMQTQALQGALGFQGRRDDLGLAEEGMRRQAVQDLASLANQQAAMTAARQDVARGLRSDAYGRQSQLDDLATAGLSRELAQRGDVRSEQALIGSEGRAERAEDRALQALMGSEGRAERMLDSDLATAGLSRDIATSAEGRALGAENRLDRLAQQEILDRILGRDISGRQTDMQAERQARELSLARAADERAERALESQLGLAGAADERAERALQQDILGQSLARQATRAGMTGEFEGRDTLQGLAARGAEERAERALAEDLRTSGLARRLAEAEVTGELEGEGSAPARRTQAALRQQAELAALAGGESRAERQLLSALGSQDLQDRIAQAGVTGMFEGEGSQRPQRSMALQALEAEQALRADEFDLRRRLAEAEQTGRYAFGDEADEYASRRGETTRALEADRRAEQMLESDLESRDLQRRLAEAGQTGRFVFADPRDEIESRQLGETTQDAEERAFRRQLAEAGLTGTFDGEDTLQRQLAEGELLGEFDGETTLQRRLAEADRTGRLAMDQREREEMMRGVSTQDYFDRYLDRQATRAGMTGTFEGRDTIQKEALDSDLETQDLARRLSEAEATGRFDVDGITQDTMQKETMDFERDRSRIGSMLAAIDLLDPDSDKYKSIVKELGDTVSATDFKNRMRQLLAGRDASQSINLPNLGGLDLSNLDLEYLRRLGSGQAG